MSAPRIEPTLTDIKKGMWLKFIRQVQYGDVYLNKSSGPSARTVYVLEDDQQVGDGLVLIVFKRPIKKMFGFPAKMFEHKGFKHCYWVHKHVLINNCYQVEG